MEYVYRAVDAVIAALSQAVHSPPAVWVVAVASTLIVFLIIRITIAWFALWWRRKRGTKSRTLTVKINDDDEDDSSHVWFVKDTRNALGFFDYETVILRGIDAKGQPTKGRSKLVEIRRRNSSATGLQVEQIEMSYRLFEMLFPGDHITQDDAKGRSFQFTPVTLKRGMQQFWFNTNDQLQYQNRFSVYLGVGLTVLSIVLSFVPHG